MRTVLAVLALGVGVPALAAGQPASPPPEAHVNNEFPQWSWNGAQVVFTSDRDGDLEVYLVNADGSNLRRLTSATGRDAHASFSHDNKHIVFQSPRAGGDTNVYAMDTDGNGVTRLTWLKGFAGVPVYSPDDRQIAFQWRVTSDFQDTRKWMICVMNRDGSHLRVLTDGTANDQVPNWTRRGDRLLFFSDRTGKNQLYTMRPDGGDVRPLVRTAFNDQTGFWSPDNRRISFVSDRDGNSELYTMDAQGRGVARLTRTPAIERSAVWSPDGRRLAYTVEDDSHTDIYVMNADGTGTRKLIP